MKIKLLLLTCFLSFHWMTSQEFFFLSGKNLTSYDYSVSNTATDFNLKSKVGSNYELGYEHILNAKISYIGSLTLNQFNSFSTNEVRSYSWNSTYLGIQNAASYTILKTENEIEVKLKAGVNLSTIIDGTEQINGVLYNIKNEPEFSGVFFQPLIGLDIKYVITDYVSLSIGYNFSKAFKFSNSTDEKLSFINNQLQLGIHFPL
ncbi:Outer membrane protein beta-barrel domain-containing protein [Flavobacterium segetis]|uniref:Outer membrane protein beta-barrel domain-containing protein n=1 Tax=Flavobacterium segetis TaxID=271157 RepID=A0A1M5HTS4_9FLAO|nr:outer membrane beta-barrel protein [Flavobacterium segetis]SHG19347.1 Outer membrane protein beta-barrel domain-containing protein [Flavobacterium segetis]